MIIVSYLKLYNDLKYLKLHNCVPMFSTRNTWFHITMQIICFKNSYLKLFIYKWFLLVIWNHLIADKKTNFSIKFNPTEVDIQ